MDRVKFNFSQLEEEKRQQITTSLLDTVYSSMASRNSSLISKK
jgi:hypothetical protein